MSTALFVKAFAGLFAIMNPFVAPPMFLSLTAGYDVAKQRRTAVRVALGTLLMTAFIIATGAAILTFFGVSVDDFRVAGGLVLLVIGLGMLNGGSTAHSGTTDEQSHQAQQAATGDVAFYPLTFPMIMGPGTITTIVIFTSHAGDVGDYVAVAVAALAVILILTAVLWFAPTIGHHLGQTLRTVMTRLMGMILVGIAVAMLVAGLKILLPGLAG